MIHRIHAESLSVIVHDDERVWADLNAGGIPCETIDQLAAFVRELRRQGAFGSDTEAELLQEVEELRS